MSPERHGTSTKAFTLLELVVVLAILAAATTVAMRSVNDLDQWADLEKNSEIFANLEAAILGDGVTDGFLADMGRLPNTVARPYIDPVEGPATELTLAELWMRDGLPEYDLRVAIDDPEVALGTGWRGPYLRLPPMADRLVDGWGQPIRSLPSMPPPNPLGSGYARLRDEIDAPLIEAGLPVRLIRVLGTNGTFGTSEEGSDRDVTLDFRHRDVCTVKATVEVLDAGDDSPSPGTGGEKVIVRAFFPNPLNPEALAKAESESVLSANSVVQLNVGNVSPGPRPVRAYLCTADGTTIIAKSRILRPRLRPGANVVHLTLHRP